MVDGYRLFSIFATTTPFLVLAAAIAMLLVAGFDQGFKPCPNFRMVASKCSSSRYSKCSSYMKYSTFCGQTMHPRVTTCCRVPCFQNFTTYKDLDGNSVDCLSQPFEIMVLTIYGYSFFSFGVFLMTVFYLISRRFPENFTFNTLVRCMEPEYNFNKSNTGHEVAVEAVPDNVDSQVSRDRAPNMSDVEQVQVV